MAKDTQTALAVITSKANAVSAINRERASELLALVQRRTEDARDAFFEIGTALVELASNRGHIALGFKSMEELVHLETQLSFTQAKQLMCVAALVPRETAMRLGSEKSYAVTQLARAIPEGRPIRALLRESFDGRRVDQMSVRELRAITRKLGGRRGPGSAERLEMTRLARTTQAGLRRRGIKTALVTPVRRADGWKLQIEISPDGLNSLLGG